MADDYRPAWFHKLSSARQEVLEELDPYNQYTIKGLSVDMPKWQTVNPNTELLMRLIELLESR